MPVESNPFDDEKLREIRESQEDPIVQYYIVRKDLNMSTGKIGAQIAHAAQMFIFGYLEKKKSLHIPMGGKSLSLVKITEKWMQGSFRKVILGADLKTFEKIKEEFDVFLVKDAGLTEVETGTETVLVLWPMLKSKCPKVLKRLQSL